MTSGAHLLGVDVGGSAVKVGLFDLNGHMAGLHEGSVPFGSPRAGWAEIDAQRWLQATRKGVRSVLAQAAVSPDQVQAMGLSNMIGTMIPLDSHGSPLRLAIPYFDTRSVGEAAWMLERAPDIVTVTGNRVLPGNTTLTSALWVRNNEPRVDRATTVWAQANTYLYHWLTGLWCADWTNASFMGLFDYRTMDWDRDLAHRLGIELDRLAPVRSPSSTAPLLDEVATELGLPKGLPVALGGLDGAMASLGVGAIHPGDAFDVSGTSEFIALCLDEATVNPGLLARWHVVPNVWVLIGAISTPGAALRWFRDELWPCGGRDAQSVYDEMTAEAAASPPGANGVVFLPHMMGERAPIWDPHARGVFYGLSLGARRGDLIRATMEGAAYAMRHLIELIEQSSGRSIRQVIMGGGAARNKLWRQIKADVWGVAVEVPQVEQASVLGAAMTAGVGAGVFRDYSEAVQRAAPKSAETTRPDDSNRSAYERSYQLYRRLYPALAPTFSFAAQGRKVG
jgi:xylulokinase